MKLPDYANIAEIISGIAVVITLVILTMEIRGSTNAVKAATYDSILADLVEFQLRLAEDTASLEISTIVYGDSPFSLTAIQTERFENRMIALFKNYERAFVQWKYGNLDEEAWQRFETEICQDRGIFFENTAQPRILSSSIQSFRDYYEACTH